MTNNDNIYSQILLVNTEVKLLKFNYKNLSIDVSINNFVGICKMKLMNLIERKIVSKIFNDDSKKCIYKKSIILIKAWFNYEANLIGSNIGLLSSYAIEILLILFFNKTHIQIEYFANEFKVLYNFLCFLNNIDFSNSILTIYGIIDKGLYLEKSCDENYMSELNYELSKEGILNFDEIENVKNELYKLKSCDKIQNLNINKNSIQIKYLNIVDPLFEGNNLGKSLNLTGFLRFVELLKTISNVIFNSIRTYHENIKSINDNYMNDCKNNEIQNQITSNEYCNYMEKETDKLAIKLMSYEILIYFNSILFLFFKTVTQNCEELITLKKPSPSIVMISEMEKSSLSIQEIIKRKKEKLEKSKKEDALLQNLEFDIKNLNESKNNENLIYSPNNENNRQKTNNNFENNSINDKISSNNVNFDMNNESDKNTDKSNSEIKSKKSQLEEKFALKKNEYIADLIYLLLNQNKLEKNEILSIINEDNVFRLFSQPQSYIFTQFIWPYYVSIKNEEESKKLLRNLNYYNFISTSFITKEVLKFSIFFISKIKQGQNINILYNNILCQIQRNVSGNLSENLDFLFL